mgnify:FL=1
MLLALFRGLGYSGIMFNKGIMKKEILNKIKKAKTIHIYNGFMEMHFKISKTDFLYEFRAKCKRQKDYPEYMNEMLTEFNDNINFDDNLNLFFN